MGLITGMVEKRASLATPNQFLTDWYGGGESFSGVRVNEHTALNYTTVFACIKILAETVGSIPLPFYERLEGGGKRKAKDHPLYRVLHDVANDEMPSLILRETMQGHLASWGNAYASIIRNNAGQVIELFPLRPDKTWPERNKRNNKLYYKTIINDKRLVFKSEDILHIPGFGFDGLVGYSPISLFADSIGLGIATERYGAKFFGNGAKPGGVLSHPRALKKEAKDYLRGSWNEMHQGLENQHKVAILEEGMTYQQIGIPPEDAQFLQTRKFQKLEMATIWRMQPHMIAHLEDATFSNIEQQDLGFVKHTMLPWFNRWEAYIYFKLLSRQEQQKYFAEFLVDGLLRGDIKSRFEAYQIASQNGWYNADEIREKENDNPQPNGQGKVYFINSASQPKERLINQPAPEGGEASEGNQGN